MHERVNLVRERETDRQTETDRLRNRDRVIERETQTETETEKCRDGIIQQTHTHNNYYYTVVCTAVPQQPSMLSM